MKKILCLAALIILSTILYAKKGKDSTEIAFENYVKFTDSVSASLHWQSNTSVSIGNGFAKLNIPHGFKYLNPEQSKYILHDLWGNPPRPDVLGMIFPADKGPFDDGAYAFTISFDEDGYVKDKDADKIDYDEMLTEMQKSESETNAERLKNGYPSIHMIGWAAKPFYDKQNKVLHWAKEFRFGSDTINTLNYEVRVLGRKGVLSLNAIATMNELELVKANIDKVLKIAEFTEGNRYKDFNSGTDKIAEYGIEALVGGTILAKTGFFALVGKFLLAAWKFILLGILAIWGTIKKFFTGRSKKDNYQENVAQFKPEQEPPIA
ncbi:MAG TPA: DUF2167 domain-containing protein [Chitinophagaceae bacterium]|nr:DUF2167 domain-containing protein [Chitinophagaceae bacterium]